MSLTPLGSVMAASGIRGSDLIGAGNDPPFRHTSDALIAVPTLAALAIVAARPVQWGGSFVEQRLRHRYRAGALARSAVLIAAQRPRVRP